MILPLQKGRSVGRSVAYHVHIVTFTAIFEQQRNERAASLGAKVGAEAPLLRSAATVVIDSIYLGLHTDKSRIIDRNQFNKIMLLQRRPLYRAAVLDLKN